LASAVSGLNPSLQTGWPLVAQKAVPNERRCRWRWPPLQEKHPS
jgi:hypothetical protein